MKICNYFKNMNQEFRLKNINETRNYFFEEIKQSELMSKKHKNLCKTLNYVDQFLILASAVTECISISGFASLLDIPIGITSFATGLKICAVAAEIKKYKSIINKKEKKHDKIVLIAKALIDSNVSNDEFIIIDNVVKD